MGVLNHETKNTRVNIIVPEVKLLICRDVFDVRNSYTTSNVSSKGAKLFKQNINIIL